MTQKTKKYKKLKNNRKNVSFSEIDQLLKNSGFERSNPHGGSSHFTYRKGSHLITIPYAKPIKETYVKKVIEVIEELKGEKNEQESKQND